MITVVAAPPYLAVQDSGRPGYRALGVPPSGFADPDTARALNQLVGNDAGSALLEWAAGGGVLRFDVPLTVAVGGASAAAMLDGVPLVPDVPHHVRAGAELRVVRLVRGRFLYIAPSGGIAVPAVLGSRSTLASAGLGGYHGRRLRAGDVLRVRDERDPMGRVEAPAPVLALPPRGAIDDRPIPVVRGPHLARVGDAAWHALLGTAWRVSHASDRAGVRLDPAHGATPAAAVTASRPSEPTCVGAVQLPPDRRPIVIMPDGPTAGGYPIIAVVARDALGRVAQRSPGDEVRFVARDGGSG